MSEGRSRLQRHFDAATGALGCFTKCNVARVKCSDNFCREPDNNPVEDGTAMGQAGAWLPRASCVRKLPGTPPRRILAVYKAVAGAWLTRRCAYGDGALRAGGIKDCSRKCRRPGEITRNAGTDRFGRRYVGTKI